MTRQPELLRADEAVLLVIDVQEAFRSHVPGFDRMVQRIRTLALGARLLDVPVVATEQYPKGLGATVPELADALDGAEILEKVEFSSASAPGFADLLRRLGRSQFVIAGIEAHVCVHQTVAELRAEGLSVHAVLDAIESREAVNRDAGVQRILADGAHASTVEMALFELMHTSRHPQFREVQALIKALDPYATDSVVGRA